VNTVLLLDEQMSEAIYNENTEEEEFLLIIEGVGEAGYRYNIKIEVADKSSGSACLLYH
jgi:hypothetical protein